MRKLLVGCSIIVCSIFIFMPSFQGGYSLTQVFRVAEEPVAITRGTYGSVLTVDLSFGDEEIEQWLQEVEKPFPMLFIDPNWAERFPQTVRIIREKGIPVGLLGSEGLQYETDAELLLQQIKKFEKAFAIKPLWFRTIDEVFPYSLHTLLWEVEINAVGSTFQWQGGEVPAPTPGEIIAIPHHKEKRTNLLDLTKLYENREFHTLEDVLFGINSNIKKMPE